MVVELDEGADADVKVPKASVTTDATWARTSSRSKACILFGNEELRPDVANDEVVS